MVFAPIALKVRCCHMKYTKPIYLPILCFLQQLAPEQLALLQFYCYFLLQQ